LVDCHRVEVSESGRKGGRRVERGRKEGGRKKEAGKRKAEGKGRRWIAV
jgi:hypothetical protein